MTESAPLLDTIDDSTPHVVEAQTNGYSKRTPASAYFRPVIKILATVTFVLSVLTIALLIDTYVIVKNAPLGYYSNRWQTEQSTKSLAKSMSIPLVVSGISALLNFPILLNVVVEILVLALIIPRVVDLFGGLPKSDWCRPPTGWPGERPVPANCLQWKLVITILMGFIAGFTLVVCIIYAIQLLLRAIAIFKTKLWKTPLSRVLPREITINFSMRVLRQEEESDSVSRHGPVYLS